MGFSDHSYINQQLVKKRPQQWNDCIQICRHIAFTFLIAQKPTFMLWEGDITKFLFTTE